MDLETSKETACRFWDTHLPISHPAKLRNLQIVCERDSSLAGLAEWLERKVTTDCDLRMCIISGLAAICAREFLVMVNLFTGWKRVHNTMWLNVTPSLQREFQAEWSRTMVALWTRDNCAASLTGEDFEELKRVMKVEFGHEYDVPDWAKLLNRR